MPRFPTPRPLRPALALLVSTSLASCDGSSGGGGSASDGVLCDVIVTTRPFDADATGAARVAAGEDRTYPDGVADPNRMGPALGIASGELPDGRDGFARRRAFFPMGDTTAPGADPDSARLNDPRVLIPNVSGLTQQFTAVGMFALDEDPANCSDPSMQFPLDVTGDATWDITTAADPDSPQHTADPLTVDPIFTFSSASPGLGTSSAASAASRVQAVRATINSGDRFCTGNGTSVGERSADGPCRHALVSESCGVEQVTEASFYVGWDASGEPVPNPDLLALPGTMPTPPGDELTLEVGESEAAFLVGEIQAAGGCALAGGAPDPLVNLSPVQWTTSAPSFVSVDQDADGTRGVLTGLTPGMSSIGATYTDSFGTIDCCTWNDTVDAVVPGTTEPPPPPPPDRHRRARVPRELHRDHGRARRPGRPGDQRRPRPLALHLRTGPHRVRGRSRPAVHVPGWSDLARDPDGRRSARDVDDDHEHAGDLPDGRDLHLARPLHGGDAGSDRDPDRDRGRGRGRLLGLPLIAHA